MILEPFLDELKKIASFSKFNKMPLDIRNLVAASLHSPDVLLYRAIGKAGPVERRIVLGAPIEHRGARFKTPFYVSTGTGSKNVQAGEMIPFNWIEGKRPSKDFSRKHGQGLWINKFFGKKQPPRGHPLHIQKLRLEALNRKGLLEPTHVIDEYQMPRGARKYEGALAVNSWLKERGYTRPLSREVDSDLRHILEYIKSRP